MLYILIGLNIILTIILIFRKQTSVNLTDPEAQRIWALNQSRAEQLEKISNMGLSNSDKAAVVLECLKPNSIEFKGREN